MSSRFRYKIPRSVSENGYKLHSLKDIRVAAAFTSVTAMKAFQLLFSCHQCEEKCSVYTEPSANLARQPIQSGSLMEFYICAGDRIKCGCHPSHVI